MLIGTNLNAARQKALHARHQPCLRQSVVFVANGTTATGNRSRRGVAYPDIPYFGAPSVRLRTPIF
jgi:hypothetical protein